MLRGEELGEALRARRGRPVLFVDLAVPRDVDPTLATFDGCFVYDVDDLEAVVATSLAGRRSEAVRAERIVATEAERFREWQLSLAVVPAITSLRARAEEIRAAELARVDARLRRLPEGERDVVEAVTAQIVNKLLHLPTVRMKEAASRRMAWSMLTSCGISLVWGRTTRRDAPARLTPLAAAGTRRPSSASDHAAGGSAASRGRPPLPAAVLLRVGSRGSRLALTQAERAASLLRAPGVEIALVPITTAGDRDRTRPFGEIGTRGVFVKELEEALLEGRIDVAVHSAKDMTSTDAEGLVVGAYTEREDPRDALCGASSIAPGMRIGTASARRRAQLLALDPSLSIEPLRGNIDTRLRKRGERGTRRDRARRLRARPAGSRCRDRPASRPRDDAPRGRAGRARPAGQGGRVPSRRGCRPPGDTSTRRG